MKNIIIVTIILASLVALVVAFGLWLRNNSDDIGPQPVTEASDEERERVKNLPEFRCPCWDDVNNICLPLADCL